MSLPMTTKEPPILVQVLTRDPLAVMAEMHYAFFARVWPTSMPYLTEADGAPVLYLREGKLAKISYRGHRLSPMGVCVHVDTPPDIAHLPGYGVAPALLVYPVGGSYTPHYSVRMVSPLGMGTNAQNTSPFVRIIHYLECEFMTQYAIEKGWLSPLECRDNDLLAQWADERYSEQSPHRKNEP